jgi:hypothetical protein
MTRNNLICLSITMALVLSGCNGETPSDGTETETTDSGDGDGDGDGGDGDGDGGDGDGDGDGGDGDGDGDGDAGDGDGDGDGDGGDGDGDGDGDGGDGDGDGDGGLSFEADVYPIIEANCSCHVLGGPAMLEMPDAATAHGNLVNVPATQDPNLNRVTPGDAANSYLYQKITGTQAGLGVGNVQMPNTGTPMSANPLSAQDMMTIEDWINGGAAP